MRRRLVPGVTIQLGSASGGLTTLPNRIKSDSGTESDTELLNEEPPGTVDEPVYDPRPPLCKLGPEEE